jgi:hypothetical protein
MGYIIEDANILKETNLVKSSLLIEKDQITAKKSNFNHYNLMRMNIDGFIMTPSFVLYDPNIPLKASYQELRKYLTEQFLRKGSTTLITYTSVLFESELPQKLNDVKTSLISSSVDFLICVKIPLRLLTPSFIRKCKREKVPAIFFEVDGSEQLEEIPWSWIKEAMFPYNNLLIPIITKPLKKEAMIVLSKWKVRMEKEKIPVLFEELAEREPLPIPILNKLGLYPRKASLLHGAEISYNLFLNDNKIKNVDEAGLFHYHCDRLVVTVHKGKVVRAGEEILYKPGYGEYVKVLTPSFFSL